MKRNAFITVQSWRMVFAVLLFPSPTLFLDSCRVLDPSFQTSIVATDAVRGHTPPLLFQHLTTKPFDYHHHRQQPFANIISRLQNFRDGENGNCTSTTIWNVSKDCFGLQRDNPNECLDTVRENQAQTMATNALQAVLYPTSEQRIGLDAEKALSKVLRSYQRQCDDTPSYADRQRFRKRLGDLVLGTSIMRLRHFYVLTRTRTYFERILGAESHLFTGQQPLVTEKEDGTVRVERRRQTVLALVRLHAHFLDDQKSSSERDFGLSFSSLPFGQSNNSNDWPSDSVSYISVYYSLPVLLARLLVDQYGVEEATQLAAVSNKPGPITIRRNALKCRTEEALCHRLLQEDGVIQAEPLTNVFRHQIAESKDDPRFLSPPKGSIRLRITRHGHKNETSKISIWSMQTWKDGCFEVQDLGSQMIVDATEAKWGDVAVDYCAGNGGKTLALASRMWGDDDPHDNKEERGRIIAYDVVDARLRQLKGRLVRAGINTTSSAVNASSKDMTIIDIVSSKNKVDSMNNTADLVLVDVPCSSSGVLRRRVGQRWSSFTSTFELYIDLPTTQLDILRNASCLVKEGGGRLIYATCSILCQENENVVDRFERLEGFDDNWTRWPFVSNLDLAPPHRVGCGTEYNHCRALLPHRHECDGFFVARWKRR